MLKAEWKMEAVPWVIHAISSSVSIAQEGRLTSSLTGIICSPHFAVLLVWPRPDWKGLRVSLHFIHPTKIFMWHLISSNLYTRLCGNHSKGDRRESRARRCHDRAYGRLSSVLGHCPTVQRVGHWLIFWIDHICLYRLTHVSVEIANGFVTWQCLRLRTTRDWIQRQIPQQTEKHGRKSSIFPST